MEGCEYEPSAVSCDCDNCVLCRLSTKAHSWKTSGQAVWANTCQMGQKAFKDIAYRGVSEGAPRREERISRTTISLIYATGRKLGVCKAACLSFCRSARPRIVSGLENVGSFLVVYNTESFLFVCILMLLGTLYSLFPSSYTTSQPVEFFLLILFTGSLLCWAAVCWWTQQSFCRLEDSTNQSSEGSPSEVMLEKPPEYESLVPLTSDVEPPAYEDVTLPDRDLKVLLPCSVTINNEVFVCEVHQSRAVPLSPRESILQDLRVQHKAYKKPQLLKCRSVGDLDRTNMEVRPY